MRLIGRVCLLIAATAAALALVPAALAAGPTPGSPGSSPPSASVAVELRVAVDRLSSAKPLLVQASSERGAALRGTLALASPLVNDAQSQPVRCSGALVALGRRQRT
jgi:hypothetical protein